MSIYGDSTTNKLVVLFVLEKMEIPLTENSILDICCSSNNWINYMDCKEILWQLLESELIYKSENGNGEEKYNITYEGRNCLASFFTRIPQSFRDTIAEYIRQNRMHFKRTQEYLSDYSKNADGSYTITLKIQAAFVDQPLFEIKIKAPSRHSAIEATKKWHEKAPIVYETMFDMLIEE
ncbi:MAG: DUF4364 family protein [Clostridia bacterium]